MRRPMHSAAVAIAACFASPSLFAQAAPPPPTASAPAQPPAPASPAPPPATPAPAAPPSAAPPPVAPPAGTAPAPGAPETAPAVTPDPAPVPPASEPVPSAPVTPSPVPSTEGTQTQGQASASVSSEAVVAPPAPPVVETKPEVAPEHVVLEPDEGVDNGVQPLTISGSFWTRYELREGYAEHGLLHPRTQREGDAFAYRARFAIRTNPVDVGGGQSVSVRFSPQAAGTHATQGAPATIGDQPALGVHEAFVRLQSRGFALDVGRFSMDYGDALVIGDLDWNEFGRAFQGGRVRLSGRSGYYTDVFATLTNEGIGVTQSIFEGDAYFFGIYSGVGPLLGPLDLDFYLLGKATAGVPDVVIDDSTTPPTLSDQEGTNFFTFGSRLKGKLDIYDYRAEAGVQFGQSPQTGGDALDKLAFQADAGLGVSPLRNLRIGVGGLVASGDGNSSDDKDDAWDELYPTSHKFLGLTDVFGARTNALSGNLEVHYAPINSLTLALQGHALANMVEKANTDGESFAGTEIDAQVTHRIGKGVKLRGMYGVFLPNGDYWATNDDPIQYFELQFGYDL